MNSLWRILAVGAVVLGLVGAALFYLVGKKKAAQENTTPAGQTASTELPTQKRSTPPSTQMAPKATPYQTDTAVPADMTAQTTTAGTEKNFLDTLYIARADVVVARSRFDEDTGLTPGAKKTAAKKLDDALKDIDNSISAWKKLYERRIATNAKPPADEASTLEEQIKLASQQLAQSRQIAAKIGANDLKKSGFIKVDDALKNAIEKVAAAQILVDQKIGNYGDSTQEKEGKQGKEKEQDKVAPPKTEPKMEPKTDGKPQPERMPVVLSGVALLLAGIAFALGFMPVGAGEKIRVEKKELDDKLFDAREQWNQVQGSLESLKTEMTTLSTKVNAARKIAEEARSKVHEERNQEERRMDERSREERSAGPGVRVPESGAGEGLDEAAAVAAPVAAVKAIPPDALAGYNTARSMKAADRVTAYSRLYPKQMIMACINPSARNNGPFTDLRFKESDFGSFLAVVDGKQTLLFPELNYDYSTGRKTLEGVFVYPESESAAYRLIRAAALEKKGDDWALVEQGVFQNG